MNVLVSGCSFTQWPDFPGGPDSCWPRYLKDLNPTWNVKSIAESAAGNQYICDSIIRETLDKKYDQILVMWTGISRLDYLTSLEDESWKELLFNSYGFFRKLPKKNLGWIFSGGQIGSWFKHPDAHKIFNGMYKVSSELSLADINLMEMIKLQNYLKAKNIPYKFMSYINYWTHGKNLSPNGDFGVLDFPELYSLINEIDFSNWIFADKNKKSIYDIAKELNDFMPDGWHPGPLAQQHWAKLVSDQLSA